MYRGVTAGRDRPASGRQRIERIVGGGRREGLGQLHKSTADDLSDCVAGTSSETVDEAPRHLVSALFHTAAGHDLRGCL